jgi:hypothetical protein
MADRAINESATNEDDLSTARPGYAPSWPDCLTWQKGTDRHRAADQPLSGIYNVAFDEGPTREQP